MRPRNARLVSEDKGDAPTQRASHISGTRVSLLLNMHKKNVYRIFSKGCSLRQHVTFSMPHIRERMCANGHPTGPAQEEPRGAQVV
jgi:hypothetical protein